MQSLVGDTAVPCRSNIHRVQKKVVYFVSERNFTTTGFIFLQFSVTITEKLVYKYVSGSLDKKDNTGVNTVLNTGVNTRVNTGVNTGDNT